MEWKISHSLVSYERAVEAMEKRVRQIHEEVAPELIWLLEHPPLYTAGSSAKPQDLVAEAPFPIFQTGRGGQYTSHGPGQRIVYVMLDLRKRNPDIRWFVKQLEAWIIETLAVLGVKGEAHPERIGVWVKTPEGKEAKIAALGIRVRKWITYHGIAINVSPNLEHYNAIIPCGIRDYGVTSLVALGLSISLSELDRVLQISFEKFFRMSQTHP